MAHSSSPDTVFRKRELAYRIQCGMLPIFVSLPPDHAHSILDICYTSLFTQGWLCSTCGAELCNLCAETRHLVGLMNIRDNY
jgi:hypothetical protein